MSDETRHMGAQGKVFKYFADRANKLTFLGDLEKATGLPGRVIQNAISALKQKNIVIETNVRGSAWTYRPEAELVTRESFIKTPVSSPPTAATTIHAVRGEERFEAAIIARADDRLVLRSDYSGELWVAKKI